MSMPQERRTAVALLIGVIAPLLIMGMHPTGASLTTGGARLVLINHMVHGVSLAAQQGFQYVSVNLTVREHAADAGRAGLRRRGQPAAAARARHGDAAR